jgi:hypothetical protein
MVLTKNVHDSQMDSKWQSIRWGGAVTGPSGQPRGRRSGLPPERAPLPRRGCAPRRRPAGRRPLAPNPGTPPPWTLSPRTSEPERPGPCHRPRVRSSPRCLTWPTCLTRQSPRPPGTSQDPGEITYVTQLRDAGMSLHAVQAQAGHRNIESNRIYLHMSDEHTPQPRPEICPPINRYRLHLSARIAAHSRRCRCGRLY